MSAPGKEIVVNPETALPANVTPMQLLQMAVAKGGTALDEMAKLMDLQERWEAREALKAYTVAMNAFKANPPVILKNKLVSFDTQKGNTSYRHALSGESSEKIGAALSEHGISHHWETKQLEGGRVIVTCILTHKMGHSERTTLEATPDTSGSKNSIQAIGSTVSYLQRYTLFAAVGLVPKDADDDGRGGQLQVMDPAEKTSYLGKIEALASKKEQESLWQEIVSRTTALGDVPAYDELKVAMAKKVKTLA